MKLREHRRTLDESLATTIEIAQTKEAVVNAVREALTPWSVVVENADVHVTHYGFDDRTRWDTHIVTVDGYGVFGFTDAPID